MITLLSVRLHNFRAVQDATFEPLATGITGLSGPNGVGKSAFLEGTLWALYGVVPRDVAQASLKRQDAASSAECYVQVEFVHQGQTIIVTRSLRGKQGTAVLDTWIDGNEATVRSVKVGEKWVRERLQLDAAGFTTAVLVRQKELDDLVEATPAERRLLIERLSGIDRMSTALKKAREDLSDVRKHVDDTRGTKEEVDDAAALLDEHEGELADAIIALENADIAANLIFDALAAAQQDWDDLQATIRAAQSAEAGVERAQTALEHARATLLSASERRSRAEEAIPVGGWDETVYERTRQSYQEARSALDALAAEEHSSSERAEKTNLSRQESLQSDLDKSQGLVDSLASKIAEKEAALEPVTPEEVQAAEREVENASAAVRAAEQDRATKVAELAAVRASLDSLEGQHECPTCHSSLADPSTIIDPLHSLMTRITTEVDKASTEIERLTQEWENSRSILRTLQDKAAEYAQEVSRIETARGTVEHHRENVTRLTAELASLQSELTQMRAARKDVAARKPALEKEVEKSNEELRKATTGRQAWVEFQDAVAKESAAESAVDAAAEALNNALAFAGENPAPSSTAVESAREELGRIHAEHVTAREELRSAEGYVQLLQERVRNAKSELARTQADYEKRRAVLEKVEHASAVAGVLDEFRKEQIARIAPELAETATSLISQMTNGKFIEIELDENFTPTIITNDGAKRPASWLSGGELSVVALSLRIAIANLLTGGTGGLLWLDEVLTAQDADRRSALIETLRSLPGHQIVMINHTQGADDIVDKTIRLTRNEEGGTVVDAS